MWLGAVLCALLGAAPAAAQSWLSNITDHLRAGTSSVLQMAPVNYSRPVINATYVASVEFDMRAMGHLYNSTHAIIDFIANKQAYPEGELADYPVPSTPSSTNIPTYHYLATIIFRKYSYFSVVHS